LADDVKKDLKVIMGDLILIYKQNNVNIADFDCASKYWENKNMEMYRGG